MRALSLKRLHSLSQQTFDTDCPVAGAGTGGCRASFSAVRQAAIPAEGADLLCLKYPGTSPTPHFYRSQYGFLAALSSLCRAKLRWLLGSGDLHHQLV